MSSNALALVQFQHRAPKMKSLEKALEIIDDMTKDIKYLIDLAFRHVGHDYAQEFHNDLIEIAEKYSSDNK